MGTDRDWEAWGREDPYFGVYSREDFRTGNLTEQNRAAFFRSGDEHIATLFERIQSHFGMEFRPQAILDFGCGVGRLLIPLARHSERALGVDISPSMLAEARFNCQRENITNVDFIGSDDSLSKVSGTYDLVNTHIVLAHIPQDRGLMIIESLASKVRVGGLIAFDVLYACHTPMLVRWIVKMRYRIPVLNAARNFLRGRPLKEPAMQLNVYSLPRVLRILNTLGFSKALVVTDHFENMEFDSVVLIARREKMK